MDRQKLCISILFTSFLLSSFMSPRLMHGLEVETHELINERISLGNFDNFSLNSYLRF